MQTQTDTIPHRLFALWIGPPMNDVRRRGLASLERTGAPVELVTEDSLGDWLVPGEPLHPAWQYLSAIHKGDYLRAYFMHHHGGGYSDIKPTTASWDTAFDQMRDPNILITGYPEVRWGVAGFDLSWTGGRYQPLRWTWWRYRWLQINHRALIGNCAYIVRPGTVFTQAWLNGVNDALDAKTMALAKNPATQPKERRHDVYDGVISDYPMTWAGIHGDIFHPLVYRFRRRVSRLLPAPSLTDYQ